MAQASVDRARKVAKEQFAANSRAIKEELAAAADAFAKSPGTLANMRKFYTLQASAAGYVEERARKEAREAFAARSKAFKEEAAKFSQESYGGAMQQLASQYTNPKEMAYMGQLRDLRGLAHMGQLRDPRGLAHMGQLRDATVGLSTAQEKLRSTSEPLSSALQALAVDGNDTHSAMRGLASGFDLLWLTWGNLAPLFSGAGISYTLTRAFSVGSEVEYQIRFMEELGHTADATGKRIEGAGEVIRQELRKLNEESMFSIVELSKAMTDLGQTNYSVAESLQILRPATALATAGLVDLDTATKTLIQVNALFDRTAEDTSRTAAQLFHITKSSVLNVEDLAGAFRYASEVNTKFHGSLEESLILFSALSKAGITGQAAGTVMINMYRDVYGRSGPAIKALEGLRKATGDTIKTFDEFGKRRPILDIIQDIHAAAQKLPLEIADKYLSKLYSARGGRNHFALAREDMEKLRKELEELKNTKPEDLFKASEGLMDTTKGATEILKSKMTNTLDEVFEAYEKGFKDFIVALTAGIRSDEFKKSLLQITAAAQGLFNVVKDNFDLVSTFGKLLLGWGALKFTVSALGGLASAITGVAGVMTLANGGMIGMNASVAANTAATGLNINTQRASAQVHYQNMVAKALMAKGYDAETARAAAATAATTVYTGAVTRANFVTRGFAATMAFMTGPVGLVVVGLGILASIYYSTRDAGEDAMAKLATASDNYTDRSLSNLQKEIRQITLRNKLLGAGTDAYSDVELKVKAKQVDLQQRVDSYLNSGRVFDKDGNIRRGREQFAKNELEAIRNLENEINREFDDIYRGRAAQQQQQDERAKADLERQKKAAAETAKLISQAAGGTPDLDCGGASRTPPAFRTWYDENYEAFKLMTDAQGAYMKTMYDQGRVSVDEYYDYVMGKAAMTAELEREHLQEQIKVFSADPKSTRAAKEASAKLTALEFKTEAEKLELAAQYNKALQENLSIRQQIEMFSKNYNEKLRGDGTDIMSIQRGGTAVEAYRAELQVRQDFLKERERIEKDFAQKSIGLSEEGLATQRALMQTALDDLRTKEAEALQIVRDHETLKAQERMNPLNGVRSALEDYAYQAQDLAGLTKTATSSMLTSLEDAFVQLATTGKASFSDMANAIMADLARIAIRQASLGLMGQALGALGGFMGGGFNMAAGLQPSGAVTSPVYGASAAPTMTLAPLPNAKGNVFMNSPSLSSFSNQVHDRPQLFAFAKGAGVFGEAGPEAIMPLTRGADGNLGVRAHGGGETNVNIEIVNNGSPVQATTTQSTAPDGTKLIKVVLEAVAGDVRGRGKIYQAIKQTA